MTNTEIINEGKKNGKTNAEINAELVAAGYTPYFGEKSGNAKLYCGVGSPEPCTVVDGKLTSIKARPHQDIVEIDGERYHVDDDGVTLIAMPAPEAPWWFDEDYRAWGMEDWKDELPKYIPDKDMMHRRHGTAEETGGESDGGEVYRHHRSDGGLCLSVCDRACDHGPVFDGVHGGNRLLFWNAGRAQTR